MVTVAILNRKGGVGKTSLTFHLGGQLAADGSKVLLIDLDPQASLTQAFFGPQAVDELPAERSVAMLFSDVCGFRPADLIVSTSVERLELLPSSEELARHNYLDPDRAALKQMTVRDALGELPPRDWILIDCPPNLALCSQAALVAADHVVVPLAPEDFACQGVPAVQRAIRRAQSEANPKLRLAGCVLNMVDARLAVHTAFGQLLRKVHGDNLFQTALPLAVHFKEAIGMRKPVGIYAPRSAAARATRALAAELIERVTRLQPKRHAA